MAKRVLQLKVAKEAISTGLRSDAYIDTRTAYAKSQQPWSKVDRKQMNDLLDDYEAMLKALKRAGVKYHQPSSVRDMTVTDDDVPAFLKKGKPETKAEPQVKRKRRVKL